MVRVLNDDWYSVFWVGLNDSCLKLLVAAMVEITGF